MTINGSTATFPVRGLLEFLATTGRTGRLVLQADPQLGLLALRSGRLVAAGLGAADELPLLVTPSDVSALGDLLVDLVSLPGGRFSFHPDGVDGADDGFDVFEALTIAREVEDADVDAFPPDTPLRLVVEPRFGTATVPPDLWEVLARLGDGTTLEAVADELGLGHAAVRRRVDGLVRLGLAEIAVPTTATI